MATNEASMKVNVKPSLFEKIVVSPESRIIFSFLYANAYYFVSEISHHKIRKVMFAIKYDTELLDF